jgi:hypothetical protein
MVYTRPGRPPFGETPVLFSGPAVATATLVTGGVAGAVTALLAVQGAEKYMGKKASAPVSLGLLTSGIMLGPIVAATLGDIPSAGVAGAYTNAVDTWVKSDARNYLFGALGAGLFVGFLVHTAQNLPPKAGL